MEENSYIRQLSGGQKHLLAPAGAVSLCPDVLILDGPRLTGKDAVFVAVSVAVSAGTAVASHYIPL